MNAAQTRNERGRHNGGTGVAAPPQQQAHSKSIEKPVIVLVARRDAGLGCNGADDTGQER